MATKKIKTLSLFTGAGGLDIGFHRAGFDIKGCVEIEPAYCQSLSANIGKGRLFGSNVQVHCEDIRNFNVRPYRKLGIECIIGGPPCQTFSAAGRRSGGVIGTADQRGKLFRAYCDILDQIHPRVFVFENVYGLPGANGGRPWQAIIKSFADLGYSLRAEVLDAADFGVPQHRERLFIVGYKAGDFEFPMPTHGPDSLSGKALVSVHDAIKDLQDPKEPYHEGLGGLYGHLLPLVPEGLNYAFFTAEMNHPEPQFAWRSKFHDLLYKVNRHEPCRTIKAQPGKFTGPFHWKNRHFSIAELRRLQSFPDDYELVGSYNRVIEQIGNSVPPLLAYVLAVSVRDQLFFRKKSLKYERRPFGFQSTFRQRQRDRTKQFSEIASAEIKRRYPNNKKAILTSRRKNEQYFVRANGFFDRNKYAVKPAVDKSKESAYQVSIQDIGSDLAIDIRKCDTLKKNLRNSEIHVSGLKKYLARIDCVDVKARISSSDDIFSVWHIVEQALVARSRFYSLIDIYGHYANRGDTVKIASSFDLLDSNKMAIRTFNYFGQSENCGAFIGLNDFSEALKIPSQKLDNTIKNVRKIRYDVRTFETHPIIGLHRVLCTYPFPLLSARALVTSKAEIVKEEFIQPRLI